MAMFVFDFQVIGNDSIDLLQIWAVRGKYWQNFKFEKHWCDHQMIFYLSTNIVIRFALINHPSSYFISTTDRNQDP